MGSTGNHPAVVMKLDGDSLMFQKEYKQKLRTPQEAVQIVQDGWVMTHGLTLAEPPALLGALADRLRGGDLHDLEVHSLLPLATAGSTVLDPFLCDCVRGYTWFVGGGDRGLVSAGLNSFVPNHLHQVPRLIKDYLDLDLFVTTVAPMDKAGFFSFGTSNDYSTTAARKARVVIPGSKPPHAQGVRRLPDAYFRGGHGG